MAASIRVGKRIRIWQTVLVVSGSIALACLLRWQLQPFVDERIPYTLFLASVAASTYWSGWRAGALATLLSLVIGTYLFAQPTALFPFTEAANIISATLFTLASAIIIAAISAQARARGEVGKRDELLREQIKERERLELELEEARRLEGIGRLAGGVAHDFNNLLMIVHGSAEILEQKLPRDELVDAIKTAAQRGSELTKQLLGFARRQIMDVQPLSLNEIVADVLRLAPRIIAEHIDVKIQERDDLWLMDGDRAQVQQVLLNLLTNARDALPSGGRICITTDNRYLTEDFVRKHPGMVAGDYVLLSVADNGTGISEELRCKIFEPFFTTKSGARTGLGLAVAYGIVKQLRGTILVRSEPKNGTVFDVYWPRSVPQLDSVRPSQSQTIQRRRIRSLEILLAEDDAGVRAVTAEILRGLGHHVVIAENGPAALNLAHATERIDVLVTDVIMPNMNGRELFDHLRARRPELCVVFVSGYTQDAALIEGIPESKARLVRKPFSAEQLETALRDVTTVSPHASSQRTVGVRA